MDSLDLLAREDEFKKLNRQLEKKTEILMKEIERSMQKQDIFSEYSSNLNVSENCTRKHFQTFKLTENVNSNSKNKKVTKKTPLKDNKTRITTCDQSMSTNVDNESEKSDVQVSESVVNSNSCEGRVTCLCCVDSRSKKNSDMEFLHAFVSVNVADKIFPQSFLKDAISVESVCKFLSSKIKLMQEQIDKLQQTINKKASQCEKHMKHIAELEGERMSLLNKTNNMKASTVEMKTKNMALQNRLDEKEKLYKEQRSESDRLFSELKRLKCQHSSSEARCASFELTIDDLRRQLDVAKNSEKEFKDSTRCLSASHQSAICRLESQIKALTYRVDKQNALIDNLRKQNAILATDGAVKLLEKEFNNMLNHGF